MNAPYHLFLRIARITGDMIARGEIDRAMVIEDRWFAWRDRNFGMPKPRRNP